MIEHHRIAPIDRFRFGHPERPLFAVILRKGLGTLWHWLPVIGAEAMLLASFLLWLQNEGIEYHGLALVFAWTIYGLIALSFLQLWIEATEDEREL